DNGAVAWTSEDSGTTNTLYGVFFLDPDAGFAVGAAGTILHTRMAAPRGRLRMAGPAMISLHSTSSTPTWVGWSARQEPFFIPLTRVPPGCLRTPVRGILSPAFPSWT